METLRKTYFFILDIAQTLLIAAAVFLVIYMFLFRPFEVNGDSMHPVFKDGEYVLTNLISLRFSELERGDVIVFESPTEEDKDFIKRVIGTPGDTISLRNGDIYVNGERLDQSGFLEDSVETTPGSFLEEGAEVIVPENSYFVMGDNRPFSSDSREWGFVGKSDIIGKSFFVYWPISNFRLVRNPFQDS